MITKARYLLPAAAALVFLAGFAAHRQQETPPVVATPDPSTPPSSKRPDSASPALNSAPTQPPPGMRSADTLDDLLAIDDAEDLYARLALWLLDAPENDLAVFWDVYGKRRNRDTFTIDLIFSQWARTNPLGAIEAAKGSGHEGIPWWAWAVNDPDAAIAAVRGASKEMSGFVMRAIGQFHPKRAMQVLEENPDFAQWNGIEGIVNGLARHDPEAALAFQREHGRTHDTNAIEKLPREDPHAALEWLRGQPRGHDATSETAFLRTLERETPEMLAELAATTPSGELKWKLESAAFRHLAETNPAEALAQARAAGSPRLAAERLAVIGKGMTESDPGKALEIFHDLIKACPDATNRTIWTRYPNGASGGGGAIEGVQPFIDDLVKEMLKHPDSLPDGWFAAAAAASPYYLVNEDPGKWLDTDLAAMDFNDEQSRQLLNHAMSYLGQKDPERALTLLAGDTLDETQRINLLSNTLYHLARKDSARAEAWVATLTDPQEIDQAHQALQNARVEAEGGTPPTPSEWLTGLADKDGSAMWRYARLTQSWGRRPPRR